MGIYFNLLIAVVLCSANAVYASDEVPECLAYGRNLPVNNPQVLHWKRTTKNQFRERGHILGKIQMMYPDRSGHEHIQVAIGKRPDDVIEVIYNQDFGDLPALSEGMEIEACGDYITATGRSGPYPPSPDGAILHWVHMNPRNVGHPAGFMMVEGVLYGNTPDRRAKQFSRQPHAVPADLFRTSVRHW